jgi:hypothetical protein
LGMSFKTYESQALQATTNTGSRDVVQMLLGEPWPGSPGNQQETIPLNTDSRRQRAAVTVRDISVTVRSNRSLELAWTPTVSRSLRRAAVRAGARSTRKSSSPMKIGLLLVVDILAKAVSVILSAFLICP